MYSLFEITLSAIDSKLKRVDNLERAMETMMLRLAENTARSDAILSQLRAMDGRGAGVRSAANGGAGGGMADTLEPRILALDEKVSLIGTKLNVLTYQLDTNSLLWAGINNGHATGHNDTAGRRRDADEDYAGSGSETSKTYTNPPGRVSSATSSPTADPWGVRNGGEDPENIRSTMASMDRHLKILIELFSEQMDKMMSAVADVRTAVTTTTTSSAAATEAPLPRAASGNGLSSINNNKLDALFQKMTPLLGVSDKVEQMWTVLVGAKSSVDALVPTSEALLWQTQRQERALSEIHSELSVKAKEIIDGLNQVRSFFFSTPSSGFHHRRVGEKVKVPNKFFESPISLSLCLPGA